eukprot:TRINITY_DN2889_c0_g1_i14.p2 TRINITY_DN2889_c0_g1~~TRINITY_DN2889_c0_g1_i14.p2  ORF type:complete len:110 (-),score=30.06 TRINITY_DN2889_c0_g1_i14:361-690(-)
MLQSVQRSQELFLQVTPPLRLRENPRVLQVILAIKQNGPQDPGAIRVYHQMLGEFEAKTIVLACTELPLLPEPDKVDKRVVDVHKLVALEALDALADTGMLSEAAIGST